MGNLCSVEGAINHWIYVKTGDRKGAGTDANIKVILYDVKNTASPEIALTCNFRNDFERGQTDTYRCPPLVGLGDINVIELWKDGSGADWFCETIMVNDARREKCFYFPVQKWIKPDRHYMIKQGDTSLPQNDPFGEQRIEELDEKRRMYQFSQQAPELPVQIYELPEDEQFSDEYKWDLMKLKAELLAKSALTRITATPWEGLEDLTNLYTFSGSFPKPRCVDIWSHDQWFGAQRLVGCNPTQIKLCTSLPENMGVTAEMLRSFLEGWTVKQIIDAKRLFVVDHKILEDLQTRNDRPFCAPIALFFLNGEKQLMPIAIQLHQDIAPDNPVFLCNDAPFTWMLAKMWFNLADASVHQGLSHLGYTHLLMESMCVSMHRCLAPNHPVFRLLAPHFQFLLAINWRGLNYLVAPGGWVDKTMTIGREGLFELIRRGAAEWRLDVQGNLPAELESRGVLEPSVLPNYSYRDDAMTIHKAIEAYVTRYIRHYYDTVPKLKEDKEIQEWGRELSAPKENGGAGIMGVPGTGRLNQLDDVIMICTCIIFSCTAQHSAVNFAQYQEFGFPPNYPALLHGEPPADKVPRLEEDVVRSLPDKVTTLDTMVITRLLSSPADKPMGETEFQYLFEDPALMLEKEFREELAKISKEIKRRNNLRPDLYKYSHLDPEFISNSINI